MRAVGNLFAAGLAANFAGSVRIVKRRKGNEPAGLAQEEVGGQLRQYTVDQAAFTVHAGSEPSFGKAGQWFVDMPDGCDAALLEGLAAKAASFDMEVLRRGHPENGGLCMASLHGLEGDLGRLLREVGMSQQQVLVETDELQQMDDLEVQLDEEEGAASREVPWGLDSIEGGGFPMPTTGNPPKWDTTRESDGKFNPKYNGRGVNIYVLDTGVRTTHQTFGGRAVQGADFIRNWDREKNSDADGVCNSGQAQCALDDRGHGTLCAGIAAGSDYGVATMARVHAVKVLKKDKTGSLGSIGAGIDWVIQSSQPSPKVASCSFTCMPNKKQGQSRCMAMAGYTRIFNRAINAGVTVVVSAGNNGDEGFKACVNAPAGLDNVITVGAYNQRGKEIEFSASGKCVDILAPGGNILSSREKHDQHEARDSGTSMAAPFVSGAVALLLREHKLRATPAQLKSLLIQASAKNQLEDLKGPATPNRQLQIEAR